MSLFPCYRLAGTVAGLEDAASDKMGKKNPYPLRADTVEEGVRCQAKTVQKYSSAEDKGYGEK